jgi:hypothetical protein
LAAPKTDADAAADGTTVAAEGGGFTAVVAMMNVLPKTCCCLDEGGGPVRWDEEGNDCGSLDIEETATTIDAPSRVPSS